MIAPLHLLFVDDDPDIRTIVELALGLDPTIALHAAASAREALALAAASRFDAALLDVTMPDMDGPALFTALRAYAPRLPVIFMTAHGRDHEVAALRTLGAAGVIVKPFEPLSLAAELRALLGTAPLSG
ncbi:response regulator [Sphingomonas sp. BK235]|uniref:response regulator n=1 Tax=Sphingomonas sp. BK235 TaxID=2512131 RepID=UPI00104E3CAC|nr:response regulator [Sphingomonas sp. BK235]TCP34769.1 response regulator receiver domain-containing protein [Sphingomonas sp. BK235]